jgi:signal transduction histidine kinase
MIRDHEADRQVTPVLIAGFALLFFLLLGSGIVAMNSMRLIQSDNARLLADQRVTAQLIDELQSEEGNLGNVFYSLATGADGIKRDELMRRLDALESAIQQTTDVGGKSLDSALLQRVRREAGAFIAEGRDTLQRRRAPADQFYRRHQNLLDALADLASSNFAAGHAAQVNEAERFARRVHYSLVLLGLALAVAVIGALFTVYLVRRMFHQVRWQAAELAQLSSRTMSDQEQTAHRLSREMHDHFGQTLSAIEANLVAMQHSRTYHPGRLDDCLGLVKDAVENVREVSQLLRPSILDDFGLSASLRWLADGYSERSGIPVSFESSFDGRLDGDRETQLFRIAQEALTNIARHSGATAVRLELAAVNGALRLSISDNGKGLPAENTRRGAGLAGMRARARAAGGRIKLESRTGHGVAITVEVPLNQPAYVSKD